MVKNNAAFAITITRTVLESNGAHHNLFLCNGQMLLTA